MERQEIIEKSQEVLSSILFKSKREIEENYREMATELLDAKIYGDTLDFAIMEHLDEEQATKVFDKANEYYDDEFSLEDKPMEIPEEQKELFEQLFPTQGE